MAAYAALFSLTNLIHTIRNHPHPPISLDDQQVESLLQKVTFLQEFLEVRSHEEHQPTEGLECLIRDASHAAEDVIESYIVDQIGRSMSHVESTSKRGDPFYRDLQKVIEFMDFIKNEAIKIIEKMGGNEDYQHFMSSMSNTSRVSPSWEQKSIMVGFDDVLTEVLDKLTGQKSEREIIPIVGMGGSGKTTLTIKAYEHSLTIERFDLRVWITISQKFKAREILLLALRQINQETYFSDMSKEEIGEQLYKTLLGRRYLIILDDMWSTEAWDKIRRFFPENNNNSRIIITTRISKVAIELTNCSGIKMNSLDEDKSWSLFSKLLFGEGACPLDWKDIGKTIVENCRGLPLSIVVIGGLLAKSKPTKQLWKYVARNLSSIVNLDDDEHCLKILNMSYKELPIYLKPCFLYMGGFPEDAKIHVSDLVRQLVAEGFLKPIGGKVIDDVAKEYIRDLADRNLILIYEQEYRPSISYCKIHDLLRDFCLREARKEKFYYVMGEHNLDINGARRIVVQRMTSKEEHPFNDIGLGIFSASFARSIVVQGMTSKEEHPFNAIGLFSAPLARSIVVSDDVELVPSSKFRLLRVFKEAVKERVWVSGRYIMNFAEFYNMRYLQLAPRVESKAIIHSSVYLLWNLQTIILPIVGDNVRTEAPVEIWKMPQLRHIKIRGLHLPSPPDDKFILRNLQTLSNVEDFNCSATVVERIPSIKNLEITYYEDSDGWSKYYLNNLEHLHELENLRCHFVYMTSKYLQRSLTLPHSIKEVWLHCPALFWEDVTPKIGSLPCLENLSLFGIRGPEWRPTAGQFLHLKYLRLGFTDELESWTIGSTHFPLLEQLFISYVRNLREIPSDVGEIPTLQCIEVFQCCNSVVDSAKKILEEQQELGNFSLEVIVNDKKLK